MKCPEQANLQGQKVDYWLPRAGVEGCGEMGSDTNGYEVSFGGMEML